MDMRLYDGEAPHVFTTKVPCATFEQRETIGGLKRFACGRVCLKRHRLMRIVHVVRQFHPAIGGLENVVKALALAQVAKGHAVRVVTLDRIFNDSRGDRLARAERLDGIEIVRVPFFGSPRYPIALSAIRHIRDADIVHVHAIDFFFDYLAWTAPFHRRRLVISTHGGFFHTPFAARLKRLYFKTITRLSLSWYAGVATVGVEDDRLFRTIRSRGVCLIENGVDVDKFAEASAPSPAKALIATGRLSSNKRLDRVIDFFAALHRLDPRWSLFIAGRSWDVPSLELRDIAARKGVGDSVHVIENPPDADIRKLMAQCSAFVSASEYEGFGLVLVEALSAGLWPLVSSIPTFSRLVEKTRIGTITDFADANAAAHNFLADWAMFCANHAHNRRTAIEAAATFRWSAVSEQYETFYKSVLGQYTRTILDIPILVKTSAEAIDLLDRQFDNQAPAIVVFANAHTLNTTVADQRIHSILDHAIVFNDGIGVDFASRLLFGKAFPENLNGTDFMPYYLQASKNRYRIFLLGGKPGIAARAAEQLAKLAPQHEMVGSCHGYTGPENIADRPRTDSSLAGRRIAGCHGKPPPGKLAQRAPERNRMPVGLRRRRFVRFHGRRRAARAALGSNGPRRMGLSDAAATVPALAPLLVQMPIFLFRVCCQWLMGARAPGVISR